MVIRSSPELESTLSFPVNILCIYIPVNCHFFHGQWLSEGRWVKEFFNLGLSYLCKLSSEGCLARAY